jgi:hypothetical protein
MMGKTAILYNIRKLYDCGVNYIKNCYMIYIVSYKISDSYVLHCGIKWVRCLNADHLPRAHELVNLIYQMDLTQFWPFFKRALSPTNLKKTQIKDHCN